MTHFYAVNLQRLRCSTPPHPQVYQWQGSGQGPGSIFFRDNNFAGLIVLIRGKKISTLKPLTTPLPLVRIGCRGGDGSQAGRLYRALRLLDRRNKGSLADSLNIFKSDDGQDTR